MQFLQPWQVFFWIWSLTFFSFMMVSFFKILSKTFAKQTIYYKKISYRLLSVSFLYFNLTSAGEGGSLNKTDIVLKLLFCLGGKSDPRVLWRNHLGHRAEILYFKDVTSAKLYALRSTNSLILKSIIKYLPNNNSIVLIARAFQNLWAFLFL